ncbi:MAG: hypothetical protein AB7Q17_12560 [Phycisphaerae bacterium]
MALDSEAETETAVAAGGAGAGSGAGTDEVGGPEARGDSATPDGVGDELGAGAV